MQRITNPVRYVLSTVISIVLASYVYIYFIDLGKDLGFQSVKFIVWAWFAALGWLVVTLKMLDIKGDWLDKYYLPKSFEMNGKLYAGSGVRLYKKFMFNGDIYNRILRKFKPAHRIISNRSSLVVWEKESRAKEFGHLIHFIMGLIALIYALTEGYYQAAIYLAILNILFNLYPIMLQRYNRARIYRILNIVPISNKGESK